MKDEQKERIRAVISAAFGGEHNVKSPTWHELGQTLHFECRVRVLSTFDGSALTSLVIAAHKYAVRVEVSPCNMQLIRLRLHPRGRRSENASFWAYHPTVGEMLASRGYVLTETEPKGAES